MASCQKQPSEWQNPHSSRTALALFLFVTATIDKYNVNWRRKVWLMNTLGCLVGQFPLSNCQFRQLFKCFSLWMDIFAFFFYTFYLRTHSCVASPIIATKRNFSFLFALFFFFLYKNMKAKQKKSPTLWHQTSKAAKSKATEIKSE